MRHCREDYDAIQPWPTKRPHHADVSGERTLNVGDDVDVAPVIPDDEPVFVLRARDGTAPTIVRAWARRQVEIGGDLATARRVMTFADEMEEYAAQHYAGGKVADTPAEWLRP